MAFIEIFLDLERVAHNATTEIKSLRIMLLCKRTDFQVPAATNSLLHENKYSRIILNIKPSAFVIDARAFLLKTVNACECVFFLLKSF